MIRQEASHMCMYMCVHTHHVQILWGGIDREELWVERTRAAPCHFGPKTRPRTPLSP